MFAFLVFYWCCFALISFYVLGFSEKLVEKGYGVLAIPFYMLFLGGFLFSIILTTMMLIQ